MRVSNQSARNHIALSRARMQRATRVAGRAREIILAAMEDVVEHALWHTDVEVKSGLELGEAEHGRLLAPGTGQRETYSPVVQRRSNVASPEKVPGEGPRQRASGRSEIPDTFCHRGPTLS